MDARPMKYGKSANLTVLRAGICPSAKKPSSAVYALTASSEFFHSQAGCEGCCLQWSQCMSRELWATTLFEHYGSARLTTQSSMLPCSLPYLMPSSLLLSLRLLVDSCFCDAPAGACHSFCLQLWCRTSDTAVWGKHQIATASCLLHLCHL